MRHLATVQKILKLEAHPNADRLEIATVLGWKCVVQKGLHQEGDLAVWMEIDSWVPNSLTNLTKEGKEPKEYEGVLGERLRTVKLRGQISQGLLLPLGDLPNILLPVDSLTEGQDLTEALGILKYEPPIPACLAGQIKGMFPSFIRKTDQERIQNLPEYFEEHKDLLFEVSVKLDGSSTTGYHRDGDVGVCSRNLDLKEDDNNSFWKVIKKIGLLEGLKNLGRNLAVQGELIGEGIQTNNEKLTGQEFYVFDIWDIDQHRYLTRPERVEVLSALGPQVKEVPILFTTMAVFQAYPDMESLLAFAGAGPSLRANIREGLVFKSTTLVNGETISFKAINNSYLLHHGG